jgi:hypothetical protein
VQGGEQEVLEGSWAQSVIVLSSPDMVKAQAWYRSPAYQEILHLRSDHLVSDAVLIDGVAPDHTPSKYGQRCGRCSRPADGTAPPSVRSWREEDRKRGFIARVVELIPWLQGRSALQGEWLRHSLRAIDPAGRYAASGGHRQESLAALAEAADVALHAPLGELELRPAVRAGAGEGVLQSAEDHLLAAKPGDGHVLSHDRSVLAAG